MQRFLYGTSIQNAVREAAEKSNRAYLVSGFIKAGFLQKTGLKAKADLKVISRWRLSDLVGRGSDIAAANEIHSFGGAFLIHPRVHAKVFLFDQVAFVGSANLTTSGLPGVDGTGNVEAALLTSDLTDIEEFFNCLLNSSTQVTKELVEEISLEVDRLLEAKNGSTYEDYSRMPTAFEKHIDNKRLKSFTGADFPWSSSPGDLMIGNLSDPSIEHDLELFSLPTSPNRNMLQNAFLQSRCYAWLSEQTTSETLFGDLSARLHNSLDGDPRPYRRDVKRLLSNLVAWALELDPEHFKQKRFRRTATYKTTR